MRMYSCHGASIITRKSATFAEPTAETDVDEVSNLHSCATKSLSVYKFHRLHIVPVQLLFVPKNIRLEKKY